MEHTRYVRTCYNGFFLLIVFLASGCSVFTPVGNTISQGYENTVSYFNGYYNAKRLFNEAEDEVFAAAVAVRGKEVPGNQVSLIPGSAKQKFGQVIDKCSNILAFHPTSSLVDDALLLIGKSFFYQAEYLKAERKFTELLAQYPKSSLVLEAQLWYAMTEEKLGNWDEGIRLSDATVLSAHSSGEKKIEGQAHQLLGLLYRRTKQTEKAILEYEKTIALSSDNELKRDAQVSLGDILFATDKYQKAIEAYLRVQEYTSDIYFTYYSKLQASIAFRKIGEYQKGLLLVNAMIEDFRNKEYLPALFFERANNYFASGKRDEAVNDYIHIDTTYARTEYAFKSAFQLGMMYEREMGNYKSALKYYSELNSPNVPAAVAEGRQKYFALTRYFNAWQQRATADSLLAVLQDTVHSNKNDTLSLAGSDTSQRAVIQSTVRSNVFSADSLHALKAIVAQELGDVFYSEVVAPDSAVYWYTQSLELNSDRMRSPRILYILAELSRTNPKKNIPAPEEYYHRLNHDFPESVYAEEARRFLGKTNSIAKSDGAADSYSQAETMLEKKQYREALKKLRATVLSYPNSPLAAKSEFAIGWILEHHLAQPESAMVQYKRVIKNHAGTPYAAAASKRTLEVPPSDTVKIDTVKSIDGAGNKDIPKVQKEPETPNPKPEKRDLKDDDVEQAAAPRRRPKDSSKGIE